MPTMKPEVSLMKQKTKKAAKEQLLNADPLGRPRELTRPHIVEFDREEPEES